MRIDRYRPTSPSSPPIHHYTPWRTPPTQGLDCSPVPALPLLAQHRRRRPCGRNRKPVAHEEVQGRLPLPIAFPPVYPPNPAVGHQEAFVTNLNSDSENGRHHISCEEMTGKECWKEYVGKTFSPLIPFVHSFQLSIYTLFIVRIISQD